MSDAATLGGWLTAGVVALIAWRRLDGRMEAVARACHELRGPITAARLGLELCARTDELSVTRLRAIDLELGRAALALDDLADLRGRPAALAGCEEVDLHQLLADSVEACQAGAAARGVHVRLRWSGDGARVRGDRLRLAQAVANLIANAIEHGGGVVEVRGRADPTGVRLEVIDSGPGLPAPVAELVRRAHGGRGARGRGLAIAASIAQAHGGRLAAAPVERGARLVLDLPHALEARSVLG
jgi:signal transduction histidine kinase